MPKSFVMGDLRISQLLCISVRAFFALLFCLAPAACSGGGSGGTGAAAAAVPNTAFSSVPSSVASPASPNGIASPILPSVVASPSVTSGVASPDLPGAGAIPILPSGPRATTGTAQVHVDFVNPSARAAAAGRRAPLYISASNVSVSVVVTPQGGASSAPVNTNCIVGSCSVNFTANPGANTIAFRFTDGAAGTGALLAQYAATVIVQPTAINSYRFTANAVLDHVGVTLGASSLTGGIAASTPVTVQGYDADNNIIAGTGNYVDTSGNPVAIVVSSAPTQSGSAGTVGLIGTTRIDGPRQANISLRYDGQCPSAGSAVSVRTTRPIAGALTGTSLAIAPGAPTIVEYSAGISPSANLAGITTGPDGALWFVELTSPSKVGRITTAAAVTEISVPNASAAIATGADGNLWYNANNSGTSSLIAGRLTPAGAIAEFNYMYISSFTDVTRGSDGNVWYADNENYSAARVTPAGVITEVQLNAPERPQGITSGADGNIWVTQSSGFTDKITRVTPAGTFTEFNAGISSHPAGIYKITSGPDGNLWFTEVYTNKIGRITLAGGITEFSTGLSPSANVYSISGGPDGNVWFLESGTNKLGRITPLGVISEFSAGISPSAGLSNITLGPDGNLWFTEATANKIAKATPSTCI